MLKLIRRCPEYVSGYREYCQEAYDNHVIYFRPTNPKLIDNEWFSRTKDWYDKKESGQIQGQPISFHFWAVDDEKFIGEAQSPVFPRPKRSRCRSSREVNGSPTPFSALYCL